MKLLEQNYVIAISNILIFSYLLVRCVNGVLFHGRVLYGLADAIHGFGDMAQFGLELRVLSVFDASTMYVVVRHLPFLFFCHLAFEGHYDRHFITDALIIICKSCCDGHLAVGFLFSGIDL